MNIFLVISNVTLLILGAGTWLFPEAASLSIKIRTGITFAIIIFFIFSIKGQSLLSWLKNVSPMLQVKIRWVVEKVTHPLTKAIYVFILLAIIVYLANFDNRIIYLSLTTFFLYLTSAKWFLVSNVSFSDTFDSGLGSWKIISGNPSVNDQFGNPSPNLDLYVVQGQKTNCFLELLQIKTPNRGIIECDVYLEAGSLFNIVFRADSSSEKWYMARLETREGSKDAFLMDLGAGWDFLKPADGNTTPSAWHKMKIELDGSRMKLFRNGIKIAEADNDEFKNGSIGIFNEMGLVHVDNFSVKKEN